MPADPAVVPPGAEGAAPSAANGLHLHDLARKALGQGGKDALIVRLAESIAQRYGPRLDAIILYGSYLRGQQDAMPDFYVLLDRYPKRPRRHAWMGALLPPNVHQLGAEGRRAKVSVLTTGQLARHVALDLHPYFWARFAQPCCVVHCRNQQVRQRLRCIVAEAIRRLLTHAAPGELPENPAAYWEAVFAHTYAAELRSERPAKRSALHLANTEYYDQLFRYARRQFLQQDGKVETAQPRRRWRHGVAHRRLAQAVGKTFSALRIIKSALTFEDPLDYLLWKLERHSGIRLSATERQRRYPLLFAWPLIWRLYRLGAFR